MSIRDKIKMDEFEKKFEEGQINHAYISDTSDSKKSDVAPDKTVSKIVEEGGGGDEGEDDGEERQQWSNPIEFLLSCIAMSVGLGNVWRFPYTAYKNGGGAFLIPYLLVLLLIGRPLYFMELTLGQFSSSGSTKGSFKNVLGLFKASFLTYPVLVWRNVWNMVPLARGVGFGQMIGSILITTNTLIALALHYLGHSFQTTLPWTNCHPELSEVDRICVDASTNITALANSLNMTAEEMANKTISSAEQYFMKGVLKEDGDITNGIGLPDWKLMICLAVCWILLFFTLWKGVASSGKIAYFTALFPYVVLFTLLVRGLTLPGAMKGVMFYLTPDWEKLATVDVWYAAVTQSFFSLSTGFGALITYSSFNKFNHNSYRDAVIISVADTLTSFLAGFVIFSILGNLAQELGVDVDKVVNSGPGLAFVSYPSALAKFDFLPQLFSVLFFLMLVTLGLGSATGLTSNIIAIFHDLYPQANKTLVTGLVCLALFAVGTVYTTPGGQAILELVDYFGGSFIIFLLAIIEVIAVAWVYGINRNFANH